MYPTKRTSFINQEVIHKYDLIIYQPQKNTGQTGLPHEVRFILISGTNFPDDGSKTCSIHMYWLHGLQGLDMPYVFNYPWNLLGKHFFMYKSDNVVTQLIKLWTINWKTNNCFCAPVWNNFQWGGSGSTYWRRRTRWDEGKSWTSVGIIWVIGLLGQK